MKKKILFTGKGNLIIDDLMEYFPSSYETNKCSPVEMIFRNALSSFRPHVVVVCLSGETIAAMHIYSILEKNSDYIDLPIIAIGSEEDCRVFKSCIFQKNMDFFVRPLDSGQFRERLDKFIALSMEKEILVFSGYGTVANKTGTSQMNWETSPLRDAINQIPDRKSILVVDDDVVMLNIIKLYLEDIYDVTAVQNGKLALKYLSKRPADLILLDYMMPEEDGPTVLRQIREQSPVPDVPVLFLTGVSERHHVLRGLELLPEGYLLKPVERDTLLARVTEIILNLQ